MNIRKIYLLLFFITLGFVTGCNKTDTVDNPLGKTPEHKEVEVSVIGGLI